MERRAETHALAYDPNFDVLAYRHLKNLGDSLPPAEFSRLASQLEARTRHNLETMLGERFNTELSQVAYRLIDGQLLSADHDEPFLEVMRRGQEYRRQFGNPQDHPREAAEILGFERVQQLLSTVNCSSRSRLAESKRVAGEAGQLSTVKIVLISPRGTADSDYQHNFFDVYEVNLDDPTFEVFSSRRPDPTDSAELTAEASKVNRQVRMSRYTSRLSYQEFHQAARQLDSTLPTPIRPTDEFFLAHPLVTQKNLEEILAAFHPQEETMPLARYQELLTVCRPLLDHYLTTLNTHQTHLRGERGPHLEGENTQEVLQTYHTLLNFADEVVLRSAHPSTFEVKGAPTSKVNDLINHLIARYGSLPVRPVMTGCGRQAGVLPTLGLRPFSVLDFARLFKADEDEDTSDFVCPGTKEDGAKCTYVVRYGSGIRKCPECGKEATCG